MGGDDEELWKVTTLDRLIRAMVKKAFLKVNFQRVEQDAFWREDKEQREGKGVIEHLPDSSDVLHCIDGGPDPLHEVGEGGHAPHHAVTVQPSP